MYTKENFLLKPHISNIFQTNISNIVNRIKKTDKQKIILSISFILTTFSAVSQIDNTFFYKTHFYNNLYYLSNIASIGLIQEIFKVEINVDISITTKTYIIIVITKFNVNTIGLNSKNNCCIKIELPTI